VAALVASVAFFGGAAQATLSGSPSNFQSNDGNMVATTGTHDWNNVSFDHLADTAASNGDDSFTSGQKQDTTCPTVEGHKNPPKDDFTDVASYSEVATNGDTFLYGATIRYAANGDASENIELKQGTDGLCTGSTTIYKRVAGDRLIAIDYLNGGTSIDVHVLTWVTSGACLVSADTAPCWGATVQSPGSAGAEGEASQSAITAANNPINGKALVAGQFAEFGINMRIAGIIPANACVSFAQTIWESRSSGSSFVSTTKDVSFEDTTLSNCGRVKIIKRTNPRGVNQAFSFTSNLAGSELTCSKSTATSFSLNDNGNTTADSTGNTQDCQKVPVGNYTVTEGANPTGFAFGSLSCTATGTGASGSQDATVAKQANITVTADSVITCVYTNNQQKGALLITKTSSKGTNPALAGATFTVKQGGTAISGSPFTTDANGEICVGDLNFGTYSVQETGAPTGYAIDDTTAHDVSVSANSTCGDGNEATFGATDTPLSDVQVRFRDGGSGATSITSMTCDNSTGTSSTTDTTGWDDTLTITGVSAPTTIVCTIVVDP
jgi:Prealbumin-like fold domain